MRFEDLTADQQELLAEAYGKQHVQKLRAMIGVPVCVLGAALAGWFFILADDSGHGGILGWPIILILGGLAAWMLAETYFEKRVRWMIRSFNLGPEDERGVLASLKAAPALAQERSRARSEIGAELKEGARTLADPRPWWVRLLEGGWDGKRRR